MPPVAGLAAPAPSTRLTRDDLIAMGQSTHAGGAWTFVPLACRLLSLSPSDHAMRFLLAANYAKLGLRTCAVELLDQLVLAVGNSEELGALRQSCTALPPDLVSAGEVQATLRANAVALAERLGEHVLLTLASSEASINSCEVFRTLTGEIVRRQAQTWRLWGATREEAAKLVSVSMAPGSPARQRPAIVEGVDPPWLAMCMSEALPRLDDGYQPPLTILAANMQDVLAGFTCTDLRSLILDDKVLWFIGPDASERLAAEWRSRNSFLCTGSVAVATHTGARCVPNIREVVAQADREQLAELDTLSRKVQQKYHSRTREYWARRFEQATEAKPGSDRALRVLVPTTRFSTFIKHSAIDLKDAIEAAGMRAHVLIEPDDSSRMTGIGHLRAVDEFDPDLVISINFTRATLNAQVGGDRVIYPATLPFVTWIQDAMAHLFRRSTGAAMGEFDFVAGHLHTDLFKQFGYPRERAVASPVLASTRKFHPGPVDAELRRSHECEVAMVTHHSQTPEDLLNSLLTRSGNDPVMRGLVQDTADAVKEACRDCWKKDAFTFLDEQIARLVQSRKRDDDGAIRAVLANQVARPLADRLLRQETLTWAAEIAERRGWRLHIYGKGWERHPTLSKYARGELSHGEELRASYQAAGVHLHASVNSYLHQRVLECALSGGLPGVRLKQSDMSLMYCYTQLSVSRDCRPSRTDEQGQGFVSIIEHPLAMRYARLLQAQGVKITGELLFNHLRDMNPVDVRAFLGQHPDVVWLLGDMGETCFWDPQSLERLIEQAAENAAWRRSHSHGISERVRKHLTLEQFAHSLVTRVPESLSVATEKTTKPDKPGVTSHR